MYRIISLSRTVADSKESQSIYEYTSEVEAKGNYELKLGQNSKSDLFDAVTILLLDNVGNILDSAHVGEELTPRLINVNVAEDGTETANVAKYDTTALVEANYHEKFGKTILNTKDKAVMYRGIDGNGGFVCYEYWVRPIEVKKESEK
jgi:hypothetical protein